MGSDDNNGRIEIPEGQRIDLLLSTAEKTYRFLAVVNSGGVVATITILGATAKSGAILNVLALPLTFFVLGIMCSMLVTANAYINSGFAARGDNVELNLSSKEQKLVSLITENSLAFYLGQFACFFLGSISGIIIVAVA